MRAYSGSLELLVALLANEVSREGCRQPRQVSGGVGGGVGVTCGLLFSRLVQGGGSSSRIALIGEVVAGKEARANEARGNKSQ